LFPGKGFWILLLLSGLETTASSLLREEVQRNTKMTFFQLFESMKNPVSEVAELRLVPRSALLLNPCLVALPLPSEKSKKRPQWSA
jgi:hypothetical protein